MNNNKPLYDDSNYDENIIASVKKLASLPVFRCTCGYGCSIHYKIVKHLQNKRCLEDSFSHDHVKN